ncbi:hypothetical protein NSTC745_02188 [Nostoc sp. DSM 114161]|jgi:hypothetical protein
MVYVFIINYIYGYKTNLKLEILATNLPPLVNEIVIIK